VFAQLKLLKATAQRRSGAPLRTVDRTGDSREDTSRWRRANYFD